MASGSEQDLSRPVIGVTGNDKRFSPSWFCIRLSIYLAGGKAKRISVRHSAELGSLAGLIISGGDDIHPSLYNAEAVPKARYDEARDELEQRHIRYALRRGMPMLGICRGYQLINVTCGGSLFGDIRDQRRRTSNYNTVLPRKTINLQRDAKIRQVIGKRQFKVNSLHHQAIDQVGNHLVIAGRDLDNFPQAMEAADNRWILGVQWHPEYLFYLPSQRTLFRWLIDQSRRFVTAP